MHSPATESGHAECDEEDAGHNATPLFNGKLHPSDNKPRRTTPRRRMRTHVPSTPDEFEVPHGFACRYTELQLLTLRTRAPKTPRALVKHFPKKRSPPALTPEMADSENDDQDPEHDISQSEECEVPGVHGTASDTADSGIADQSPLTDEDYWIQEHDDADRVYRCLPKNYQLSRKEVKQTHLSNLSAFGVKRSLAFTPHYNTLVKKAIRYQS